MPAKPIFLIALAAACSSPSRGGGGSAGDGATTLATIAGWSAGVPARLAATDTCIVVGQAHALTCAPVAGGAARPLATLADSLVSLIGAGASVVASTTPDDFGPSDATMAVARVDADGSVAQLIDTAAGFGPTGLARFGSDVVFTTGGDADLDAVPLAGGSARNLGFDSGNFGDLAIVGTTAYYVNEPSIYAHDLTRATPSEPGDDAVATGGDFEAPVLATDGTTLVAAGMAIEATGTDVIALPAGPTLAPLPVGAGRLAVADGTAYVIAGSDLHAIDLADGTESTAVAGESPVDVLATADQLIWLTADGRLRAQAR
jgi:hypothetical protein|nr:hypothetical protein [Kofleriaceae bacterium]